MAETAAAPGTADVDQSSNDIIEGFNKINLARQLFLMVGLAASVAIGFAVVLWSQGDDYKVLYQGLDRMDINEIDQILKFNNIPYKIDGKSGALMVPVENADNANILLAENGITGDRNVGYELLDQEQPLGTSQFMEATRYRRGVEGELARTISSINSIKHARVLLAIPKQTVFVRDGREPSASVFLDLYPGRELKKKQVKGIANLVSASIPELDVENVSIVDQRGNPLSAGLEDKDLEIASQHRDYTRKVEDDIVLRVRRLLTSVVGPGNFKTEVNADIDFTEIEQAEEVFNPDLPAVRSEQVIEEQKIGAAAAGGIPGALTNQPPNDGAAPQNAAPAGQGEAQVPSNTRSQTKRNYELDRTLSFTRMEKGRLRRLSVAVVIDDKKIPNPESGDIETVPWAESEIERLTILIRDAVGFNAARGDSVNILNEAFYPVPTFDGAAEDTPIWETEWFRGLAKQVAGVFIILALIMGLMRPVLKSLASTGAKSKQQDEAKELAALQAQGLDAFDTLSDETVTLSGGDALALPSPEESYEQQINAVKGLVAEDAGRVAQVVKRWVNEE